MNKLVYVCIALIIACIFYKNIEGFTPYLIYNVTINKAVLEISCSEDNMCPAVRSLASLKNLAFGDKGLAVSDAYNLIRTNEPMLTVIPERKPAFFYTKYMNRDLDIKDIKSVLCSKKDASLAAMIISQSGSSAKVKHEEPADCYFYFGMQLRPKNTVSLNKLEDTKIPGSILGPNNTILVDLLICGQEDEETYDIHYNRILDFYNQKQKNAYYSNYFKLFKSTIKKLTI